MNREDLSAWWRTPLGVRLEGQERRVVAAALEDAFGLQLLQVGVWGDDGRLFEGARTQRQSLIAARPPASVLSRPSALGVGSDCVDAVLLPHTLEYESDPYAVLREASRVLVGDGKLLVLGFNPLGPWALRHRFSSDSFPPGLRRLVSPLRLREWLRVLSFEVSETQYYLHELPLDSGSGRRWPWPAGAYLLRAHKRVYTLTPLRPMRRGKRARVGGLVEPTT